MCTGEVINIVAKLRSIGMRADVMIDVSAVEMLGILGDVDIIAEINVVAVVEIAFDFLARVSYALEVLTGQVVGSTSGIGADVRVSGLAAMMTALDFAVPALLEGSSLSC